MAEKPHRPTRPSPNGPGGPQPGAGSSKAVPTGQKTGRADVERAMALAAVMDHAVKVHKETSRPVQPRKSHAKVIVMTLLLIPSAALAAYAWFGRPEFLWGPGVKPLPVAQAEAGLRWSMYLLAHRVEAYYRAHGEYPSSLTEVGDSVPGVSYVGLDSVFELRAVENGKSIILRSDRDVDEFLGPSPLIIQGIIR